MAYFKILLNLLNNKVFEVYGDGKIRRDFTYVQDTVEAIHALMLNMNLESTPVNDVVNVGGGNPHSLLDLITTMEKVSNRKLNYKFVGKASGDVEVTNADVSLQRRLTDFVPSIDLEEGVSRFLKWGFDSENVEALQKWFP